MVKAVSSLMQCGNVISMHARISVLSVSCMAADDSADCIHHAGEPTTQPQAEPAAEAGNNGNSISIAEAAALADAIALQASDLQEHAPEEPEPTQPFRPNPESVTSNRPKKMRLLKTLL